MGRSRRGVGRGLALALLLACFASVNSSEHHDSSFRGDAMGARRGDVAATAGADAIPAVPVSRPPEGLGRRTPRAALGKASTAKEKSHLDVHALRRRAEELDDAMVDEDDALDALDESGSAEPLETPATGAEYALLEIEAAAAEAEARAFDEAFPELVRFQDEDEDAAGERSAAFHRRAEEAQTREAADGSVGTTTQTQSKRSAKSAKSVRVVKSSKSSSKKRRAAEGAEEATTDTTSAP